jgi:hypothetical protein
MSMMVPMILSSQGHWALHGSCLKVKAALVDWAVIYHFQEVIDGML